jgi:hypothetical protein
VKGPKIRFEGLKSDDWDGSGRRFEPPGAIDPRGYAGRYGVSQKTRFVREIRRITVDDNFRVEMQSKSWKYARASSARFRSQMRCL